MSVSSFYLHMLEDPELPPEFQERVLSYGTDRKDYDVLAVLAQHPGLVPSIDERLGKIEAAKVRAPWLSRPDRKAEEVLEMVAKERRSGALTALAAMDLPEEAYNVLLVKAKTVPPLIALASNEAAPLELRKKAVSVLGTLNWTAQHKNRLAVKALVSTTPELADAFACACRDDSLMKTLAASEHLSDEAIDNIVKVGVHKPVREGADGVSAGSTSYNTWRFNSRIAEGLEVAHVLAANPTVGRTARQSIRDYLEEKLTSIHLEQSNSSRLTKTITALSGDGETGTTTLATAIQTARATTDPETIVTLVERARSERDSNIALALASNPNLGTDDLDRIVDVIGWEHREGLVTKFMRDPERLATVIRHIPHMLSDDVIGKAPDPEQVLLHLARKLARSGRHGSVITQSRFMTATVAGLLPVSIIGAHSTMSVEVRRAMRVRVSDRLGDSPARWATFESMFANYSGSLDELLDVCEAIDI
jgi:hypothetical protein